MSYELFIARRLQLGGNNRRSPSASIVIATVGIALSLAVMMITLCIVVGFKHAIRDKVMGFDAHITLHPEIINYDDIPFLTLSPGLEKEIKETPGIESYALAIKQPGVLKTDSDFQAIVMKSLEPGQSLDFIKGNITEGEIPDYSKEDNQYKIVISSITADKLSLKPGDKLYSYFFIDDAIKTRRVEVSGVYDTHFSDYDNIYAFVGLDMLRQLNNLSTDQGNMLEMRVNNLDSIDSVAYLLQNRLMQAYNNNEFEGSFSLSTVNGTAFSYFNWLALLDTNVVVILILMMIVTGFTLISSLFIIILERVNMIGILKALGSTNREIRRIFIMMTQRLVIRGMVIGNIIGLTFLFIQENYHLIPLNPDSYYLNYVPVEINPQSLVLLNIGVFVISWLITLLPSRIVAGISPRETINYE
jgi:lipoprotein-releasing system permease protein